MKNSEVARAWAQGKPARTKNFSTDGLTLFSYDLVIGKTVVTPLGTRTHKVVYDYTAQSGNFRSQTTSTHVGKASYYCDELVEPGEVPVKVGIPAPSRPDAPWHRAVNPVMGEE